MDKKLLIEAFQKIKPTKSFWGIFSAFLIFIVPEIAAFVWGDEIKAFFDLQAQNSTMSQEQYAYSKLGELLSEGSWINLTIGVAILVWAFF